MAKAKKKNSTKKTTQKKVVKKSKTKTQPKKSTTIEIDIKPPVPKSTKVGSWAFIIGFIFAIGAGFIAIFPGADLKVINFALIACGIIIGFLNIRDHETKDFMIAGAILVLVSYLGLATVSKVEFYKNILFALQTLFVPATLIVALRVLFVLGHRK